MTKILNTYLVKFAFENDIEKEDIARKIAIMILTQGPNQMDTVPSDADIAAMQQKIAKVQSGEDKDISSVLVTMPVYDLNGTDKKYVERSLIIFPGNADLSNLPADTVVINDVHNFAFSGVERNEDGTLRKRKGIPGMLWTHEAGHAGGIVIDGNEMWFYFGPSYFYSTARRNYELVSASLLLEKLIASGRGMDINPDVRHQQDYVNSWIEMGYKTE